MPESRRRLDLDCALSTSASDAHPNFLKPSEQALPKQVMRVSNPALCPEENTLKCVGKKNPGANQAH
jgi:hypothetical protein